MNIVICDDKKGTAEFVKDCLKNILPADTKISVFESGYAMDYYVSEAVKGDVDIIITDIDLCELNGIDVAKRLVKDFPHIKIIYISGYPQYIQRVFETEPVYFLTKPIQQDLLAEAINKAQKLIETEQSKYLLITTKAGIVKLHYKKITYIESSGRITIVHEYRGQREFYKKLDDVQKELPSNFVRCHKSFIVNLDKVQSLSDNFFVLNDSEIVPISQSKYGRTKEIFMNYLGNAI